MRIMIGTPVYDEQVLVPYHSAVMNLVARFRQERPDVVFDSALLSGSLVARTRSVLASRVLADPRYSHLLFIDSDMGFAPTLILKMLALDEPVVGCLAPVRKNDYARLQATARPGADAEAWRFAAHTYIPDQIHLDRPQRSGFVQAPYAGTGIMLIRRDALEGLREAHPELVTESGAYEAGLGYSGPVFHAFAETLEDGEDAAFCARWKAVGGDIWVCTNETIIHVGRERFIGNYLAGHRHRQG